MLNKEIEEIIELNNEFYQKHSESFDRSREYYWEGFKDALKYIKKGQKILDLGCGNARFYKFLKENNSEIEYLGVDSNEKFIKENKIKYPEANFELKDIISNSPQTNEKFNIIVIFGVTHHLPKREFRKNWFKNLEQLLTENGILVISFWNFDKSKDDLNFIPKEYIKEQGDYFLGWKGDYSSHRYCHDYNQNELEEIKNILSNFKIIEEFNKEDNHYLILKMN